MNWRPVKFDYPVFHTFSRTVSPRSLVIEVLWDSCIENL